MACYHPIKGYRARTMNSSGKRPIVFNVNAGFADLPVEVPCGQCIGCRIARSRAWAVRCVHEASLHEKNIFVTLTYSNECLPEGGTLVLKHFQDFMKRLRFKYGSGIRFFHCGEYGDEDMRPHYHAILFNHDFEDKYIWKKSGEAEHILWRSPSLEELWPWGHSCFGAVTFQSAAYCARYVMKKMTGPYSVIYEPHMDEVTGEIYGHRLPPYVTMSRRPGLAKGWYEKFAGDVYPDDFVILLDGTKSATPAFYDKQLPEDELRKIKSSRVIAARRHAANNTPDRLAVREVVQEARLSRLKRDL
ncbi:MAG: replication initiator protein [Microviridae sp.]|nr:MAG: replication initiator protein [Microviridae sp.]